MYKQFPHAILPETTHDELARQNFVQSLKTHIMSRMSPGTKAVYEKVAKPRFEQEYQRSPQDRFEIRQAMENEPYYRWWGVLQRTQQEMMWESVSSSVERQLEDLIERAKDRKQPLGSLTLDPDFNIPAYQKAVDIHCMPGGYSGEFREEDITVGAIYDRGVYLYGRGWLGPLNDDMGTAIVHNYLQANYPDWQPQRILDLGCSVGHSTLPYGEVYPQAEVHGIDLSAPLLRYAHARAEALAQKVHFSQQNAEKTNFADQSCDLIVSHILLHEIPVPAIRNVLRECRRLLAPGGMMIHAEAPLYRHMDIYAQFVYDWQTANNNEPFWSAMRDLDLKAEVIAAGFAPEQVFEAFVPNGVWREQLAAQGSEKAGLNNRGSWLAVGARG